MATHFDLNEGWSETEAGTGSGATATKDAGATGVSHVVTHVSGHSDIDATLQLKDGSTVLAEWKIDASVEGFQFNIPPGVWVGTAATAITGVISASSADCQVNLAGFSTVVFG